MELNVEKNETVSSVLDRLKFLECPLLENGEEWWLLDLLFTPGTHRLQLFDWVLSKIEHRTFSIGQLQDPDEWAKNLLSSFSILGFCQTTDLEIFLGLASKSLQLKFWHNVTQFLTEQLKYLNTSSSMTSASNNENKTDILSQQVNTSSLKDSFNDLYEKSCKMNITVASSVDIEKLFLEDLDLFPADAKNDMKVMFPDCETDEISSLQELITKLLQKEDVESPIENLDLLGNSKELLSKEQTDLQKELLKEFVENSRIIGNFEKLYNDLKPVLHIQEVTDNKLGASFEELQLKQSPLSEAFINIQEAKSCLTELKEKPTVDKDNLSNLIQMLN